MRWGDTAAIHQKNVKHCHFLDALPSGKPKKVGHGMGKFFRAKQIKYKWIDVTIVVGFISQLMGGFQTIVPCYTIPICNLNHPREDGHLASTPSPVTEGPTLRCCVSRTRGPPCQPQGSWTKQLENMELRMRDLRKQLANALFLFFSIQAKSSKPKRGGILNSKHCIHW